MKNREYGYVKINISREQRNMAMNAILINQLSYKKSRVNEDLTLELTIKGSQKDRFKSVFEDNGIDAEFSRGLGIEAYLARYRHRWGAFLGIFILFVSVYLSSLFVWRIDIEGNEHISDEQVLKTLENAGFSLGSFIPSVDYDVLHNKFLLESEDVSWISVNIKGNVAKVLVKERMKEKDEEISTYTNVVASSNAQIALVQIYNGEKVVSIGDVVKKGDLLISGIMDSKSQGVRYVHADGIVKGYVNKHIFIKAPLKSTQKAYTGKVYTEKSLKIFSKSINFSPKYRNSYNIYDKIEVTNKICIFGSIELPIEITTTYYKEYEEIPVSYTYEQAVDIAFSELRSELDSALSDAELVSKKVATSYDKEGFYIDCELYCIENIAALVKFEVN